MEDSKPAEVEPVMRCEPIDVGDGERDGEDLELPSAADDRTLEEAGYGYGV